MKTNFSIKKNKEIDSTENSTVIKEDKKQDLTEEEFEEFVSKSGAAGSFMVFRSKKKDDELGIDAL